MPAYISDEWQHGGYAKPSIPVPPPTAPAVNFEGSPLAVADAKIRHSARKFAEYSAQLDAMPNLDARAKAQALESFSTTPAARDAAASVDAAKAYRDELAARPAAAQATLATPLDAGHQLDAQRRWERARTQLDAQQGVAATYAAARGMIDNADSADQLNVLNAELVEYLASKNQPSSWVADAIAARSPELGSAHSEAAAAERITRKIEHNARVVQNAYANHKPVNTALLLDPT